MHIRYREEKAAQAAARLLKLRGGRMSHLKLIKLLYLADRAAYVRWGRPITHDQLCSMPHGPVVSLTLDRINEPEEHEGGYWSRVIAPKVNNEVSLVSPHIPNDQLSPAEEVLLDEVFAQYGALSRWQLRDLTHTLPEWRDPQGSSCAIEPATILRSEGYSAEEAEEILRELEESAIADALF